MLDTPNINKNLIISSSPRSKVTETFKKFKEKEKEEKDKRKEAEGEEECIEAKLFSSCEEYLETMPWRDEDNLLDNPWYVEKADLENCLKSIKRKKSDRKFVYYLCSPSNSGKSAAALNIGANYNSAINNVGLGEDLPEPIDLFLYLPFDNNKNNHLEESPNFFSQLWKIVLYYLVKLPTSFSNEDFGGLYMYLCLKTLLEKGKFEEVVYSFSSIKALFFKRPEVLITNLLKKHNLENFKFLVNVDEHRKISDNKDIRRGAMLALAAQSNFTVLATYTKPLTGIPSEGSSGVCRHPLQLIPLSQKTILVDNYQSKLKTISSKLGELYLEKLPNSEFLKLAGKVLSHLALLKNFERQSAKTVESKIAKEATNEVLDFLSSLLTSKEEWKFNPEEALNSLKDGISYPKLKSLRSYVYTHITGKKLTETDYVDFLSLTPELSVDVKMENTDLTLLSFPDEKKYFCQPLFNILRTGSSTTDTPQMADLWVGCKDLFREKVLNKDFLDNSFIEFGYAWNLCFSKIFIEMVTKKKTPYIKELKRRNLMLKKGNKVNKDLLKTLEAGTLYVPVFVNHAGCDIFCVLNVENQKVLICIEIKSGKNGLIGFQEEKFPKLLNEAIKEVKKESKELVSDEVKNKLDDENKIVDRAEYLVLRPGVKDGHEIGDSPFPWKEIVGSSALELLGPFVQLIPSMIEAEHLFD